MLLYTLLIFCLILALLCTLWIKPRWAKERQLLKRANLDRTLKQGAFATFAEQMKKQQWKLVRLFMKQSTTDLEQIGMTWISNTIAETIQEIKVIGERHASNDLEALIAAREHLKELDDERWKCVECIEDCLAPGLSSSTLCQHPSSVPSNYRTGQGTWTALEFETKENKEHVNRLCIEYMSLCADWNKEALYGPVLHLARLLDNVDSFGELADVFPSVIDGVHRLPLKSRKYPLWHDPNVSYSGQRIHVKFAAIKDVASAVRKAMAYFDEHEQGTQGTYARPACRYITDMLRLTVSAADPYMIYLFLRFIHAVPTFNIMQVKNKYAAGQIEASGSPSVLLKIEVTLSDTHSVICEVQLYVDCFLSLKKLQHKTYEINRVDPDNYLPLLRPLFSSSSFTATGAGKANAITEAQKYFLAMELSVAETEHHPVEVKEDCWVDANNASVEMTTLR